MRLKNVLILLPSMVLFANSLEYSLTKSIRPLLILYENIIKLKRIIMKRTIIIVILIIIQPFNIIYNHKLIYNIEYSFVYAIEETTNKGTDEIISNNEEIITILDSGKEREVAGAFLFDVVKYFGMEEQLDTPLKKKMFIGSKEFQDKKKELERIKSGLISKIYAIKIPFNEQYNLHKKGFLIKFKSNFAQYNALADDIPKTSPDGYFYFGQLPTIKDTKITGWEGTYTELLLLPMDENEALEIENNKGNIELQLSFKIGQIKNVQQPFVVLTASGFIRSIVTSKLLSVKNLRVQLINTLSGKLYYDKVFK